MQSWLQKRGGWRERSTFRKLVLKEFESQLADVELYAIFHFFLPTINCPACAQELLVKQTDSTALMVHPLQAELIEETETICHYQAFEETL